MMREREELRPTLEQASTMEEWEGLLKKAFGN